MAKTYKTWELLRMADEYDNYDKPLIERPKFRNPNTNQIVTFINCIDGKGIGTKEGMLITIKGLANREWELVQEPVSFMEAVKAYAEGKTIRCERKLDITIYDPNNRIHNPQWLVDNNRNPICSHEILNGQWFIEE